MAFCPSCGAQVTDGVKFCHSCGNTVAPADEQTYQQQQPPPYQPPYQQPYQQPGPNQQYQQPPAQPPYPQGPPPAGGFVGGFSPAPVGFADPRDVAENKTMAILAYFFWFIPLLTGAHRTSPFVRFHTNQAVVMVIASFIYTFASFILSFFFAFIPIVGPLLIFLLWMVCFIFPVFIILGCVNASAGQLKPLPLIGNFIIIK